MEKLIKSSYLQQAHLMDFAEVMSIVSSFLEKEDLTTLKLTEITNEFNQQLNKLEEGLVQSRKTGLTDNIVEADQQRDNLFIGFYSLIKGMTYFPNDSIAEMAEEVIIVIEKYDRHINRLAQREETAVLSNLIDDLKSEAYQQHINDLNLTPWVTAMEEANNRFQELYTQRTEEKAKFVVSLAKTERDQMQKIFTKLCEIINAYAIIEGEENYKSLADKINTEINNVKQRIRTRGKKQIVEKSN